MVEILSQAKDYVYGFGLTKATIVNFISLILLLMMGAVIIGGLIWLITNKKKYTKKIIIWEEINGQMQVVGRDVAEEILLATGSTAFYLKKRGKHLARPTKSSGVNTYYFIIKPDGSWENFGLEKYSEKAKELKLDLNHADMRHTRASLQKLLRENFKKEKWWQKAAPYIGFGILILMLSLAAWLIMGRMDTLMGQTTEYVKISSDLASIQKDILSALDNICSTSGIRPVG